MTTRRLVVAVLCLGLLAAGCGTAGEQRSEVPPTRPAAPATGAPSLAAPTSPPTAAPAVIEAPARTPGTTPPAGSVPAATPAIGGPTMPAVTPVAGWQTYRNEQYRFEVQYPPEYMIVDSQDQPQPPPLLQVWFQDRLLAGSPVLHLEPPKLAIAVYENARQESLTIWLQANLPEGKGMKSESVTVAGVEGVRLTSSLLMAPNSFIYVAQGRYVYKLTPLGPFSEQMIATLRFLP